MSVNRRHEWSGAAIIKLVAALPATLLGCGGDFGAPPSDAGFYESLECSNDGDCAAFGLTGHRCILGMSEDDAPALAQGELSLAEDAGEDADAGVALDAGADGGPWDPPTGHCSLYCEQNLCNKPGTPLLKECSGVMGTCKRYDCGRHIPCAEDQYCELSRHSCRPSSGACKATDECPEWSEWLGGNFGIECAVPAGRTAGQCAFAQIELPNPLWQEDYEDLRILQPKQEGPLDANTDLVIEWESAGGVGAALVGRERPTGRSELASGLFWGAFSDTPNANGNHRIRWSQGATIADGKWTDVVPELPPDTDLYLVVLELDEDELTAGNAYVRRFRVGAYPEAGAPCSPEQDDFGQIIPESSAEHCSNPIRPLACIGDTPTSARCRELCFGTDCSDGSPCVFSGELGVWYCL